MKKLTIKDGSLWKITKTLTGNHRKIPPPIKGTNGTVYTAAEKAETFADSLEEQFSLNDQADLRH